MPRPSPVVLVVVLVAVAAWLGAGRSLDFWLFGSMAVALTSITALLDDSDPEEGESLPDADDVLAKWLALRMDEEYTLRTANVHPLGRQLDPAMVRHDLSALRQWQK